jgi:hypothetical protein
MNIVSQNIVKNVFREKGAVGSSPGVSLGKASSQRPSLDGLHQVDNCYAEPKLTSEAEPGPRPPARKASQRQLLNQIAYGASDRLHSAKLNQCHLHHRACKCASAQMRTLAKLGTAPDPQMLIQEETDCGASGDEDAPARDAKQEAFKLDLHHLGGH